MDAMRKIWLLALVLAATTSSCGEGTINFGSGNQRTTDAIVVEGDIRDVNPQVAGASIVVFVYTDLKSESPPFTETDYEKQRSAAVSSTAEPQSFVITQIASGDLTVMFLQDSVSEPDATIDAGDPYAVLEDPNDLLQGARGGETLRINEVDIDFNRGSAEAVSIRSVRKSDASQQ